MHINKCKKTTHGFWVCRRQFETCDILQTTDRMQNIFLPYNVAGLNLLQCLFYQRNITLLMSFCAASLWFQNVHFYFFCTIFALECSNLAFLVIFFMRIRTTIFQVSEVNSFFLRLCLLSVRRNTMWVLKIITYFNFRLNCSRLYTLKKDFHFRKEARA